MAASNTGDQHMAEKDPDILSLNELKGQGFMAGTNAYL